MVLKGLYLLWCLLFLLFGLCQRCHILHRHFFHAAGKQEMLYSVVVVSLAVSNNSEYFVPLFLDGKNVHGMFSFITAF